MTSIIERDLGADAARLHPAMRRRCAMGLDAGVGSIGRGVMSTIRVGPAWVRPIVRLLAAIGVSVPRPGRDVPFEIRNTPGRDADGHETLEYDRAFGTGPDPERFVTTLVWTGSRSIDRFGRCGRVVVRERMRVTPEGGVLTTSERFGLALGSFVVPIPVLVTGRTVSHERYDDALGRFRITVALRHPLLGVVVGYDGTFTAEEFPLEP